MHNLARQPEGRPAETPELELRGAPETGTTQSRIRDQFEEDQRGAILTNLDQVMADAIRVREGMAREW